MRVCEACDHRIEMRDTTDETAPIEYLPNTTGVVTSHQNRTCDPGLDLSSGRSVASSRIFEKRGKGSAKIVGNALPAYRNVRQLCRHENLHII